jgi:hypothetical protein
MPLRPLSTLRALLEDFAVNIPVNLLKDKERKLPFSKFMLCNAVHG